MLRGGWRALAVALYLAAGSVDRAEEVARELVRRRDRDAFQLGLQFPQSARFIVQTAPAVGLSELSAEQLTGLVEHACAILDADTPDPIASLPALLDRLVIALRKTAPREAARGAMWPLRQPASSADLVALEGRLGRRLPDDYRAFLERTDGLQAAPATTLGGAVGYGDDDLVRFAPEEDDLDVSKGHLVAASDVALTSWSGDALGRKHFMTWPFHPERGALACRSWMAAVHCCCFGRPRAQRCCGTGPATRTAGKAATRTSRNSSRNGSQSSRTIWSSATHDATSENGERRTRASHESRQEIVVSGLTVCLRCRWAIAPR
jgi:hypothetical protein